MKVRKILFFLFFLLNDVSAAPQAFMESSAGDYYHLEVAVTDSEKARGLMYRYYLPPWEGMLFLFDPAQDVSFWMKNTFIPLNIYFFDSDKQLLAQYINVQPCLEKVCPTYPSKGKAAYVIETRGRYQFDPKDMAIKYLYIEDTN